MKSELTKLPLVTVAIPTYNRIDLLKRCLNSILVQDYINIEICISDNGSIDETNDYLLNLKDIRIKININPTNCGMSSNWNKCLSMASGKYFLLMSDDDALANPDAISKFVEVYESDKSNQIGIVFSDVYIESNNGERKRSALNANKNIYKFDELIADFFKNKISIFPCATFFRTQDLRLINGYDKFGVTLAVDACAWISILKKYIYAQRIPEPLSVYRNHQSLSSSPIEIWKKDLSIIKDMIKSEKNSIPPERYNLIVNCINEATSRAPLGYIIRQIKYNNNYKLHHLFIDIFNNKFELFSKSNLIFIVKKIN